MLKVSQNNENHCATFCGKPVETVKTVENAHSAYKEWIEPSSAYATHGKALKRHSKQRNITVWLQLLKKGLTTDIMLIMQCKLQKTKGEKEIWL